MEWVQGLPGEQGEHALSTTTAPPGGVEPWQVSGLRVPQTWLRKTLKSLDQDPLGFSSLP